MRVSAHAPAPGPVPAPSVVGEKQSSRTYGTAGRDTGQSKPAFFFKYYLLLSIFRQSIPQVRLRSANPEGLEGGGHQREDGMPRAQTLFSITGRRSQDKPLSCSLHAVFVSRLGRGPAGKHTTEGLWAPLVRRGTSNRTGETLTLRFRAKATSGPGLPLRVGRLQCRVRLGYWGYRGYRGD